MKAIPSIPISILLLAAACLLPMTMKAAGIDKKFYKKAAEKVWAMDMPQFNPKADLSDSIFQDQSANYIARYVGLVADYNDDINPTKFRVMGKNEGNATQAVLLQRFMVKVNDAAAIDHFSDFSINPPQKENAHGYVFLEIKPAFGARIFKPNGTVVDVDMNEAVSVTSGKKNKDVEEYKIAIPGLAVGDILDYFYYTDYYMDELSMPSFNVMLMASYPTANLTVDLRVSPKLALEYGSYNGAPRPNTFPVVDGKNQLLLEFENVLSLDEELPFFAVERQMPFMRINVVNHSSKFEFHPSNQRAGGMRIAATPFVLRDVAATIFEGEAPKKTVGDATSIVKAWMKNNPEATPTLIADIAWLALKFSTYKNRDEEGYGQRKSALAFYDVMDKVMKNNEARIGITTSRSDVPIDEISHYGEADFFNQMADRNYFCNPELILLPGEIPAGRDMEKYIVYTARPDNKMLHASATPGNFPKSKSGHNNVTTMVNLTIDPDNSENLKVASTHRFKGATKRLIGDLVPLQTSLDSLASYLGAKPFKVKNLRDAQEVEEERTEEIRDHARLTWNSDDAEMTSYTFRQLGVTPANPDIELAVEGNVTGAITQAGNNLMINVGRFIGKQQEYKGKNRQRDISIVRPYAMKYDTTVRFEIPEGYELIEESLNDVKVAVANREGAVNTETKLEGNILSIRYIERYANSLSPIESWPDILALLDAAHAFNSATIAIRRK